MDESKMFMSETGDDQSNESKPLPPRIKEALEKMKKKQNDEAEKSTGKTDTEDPKITSDIAQIHNDSRAIEEHLFKATLDEFIKNNDSEEKIEELKNGYKEYTDAWDRAFLEKGDKISLTKDVYPRLSSNNLWLKYSKRITEKYFGIERN